MECSLYTYSIILRFTLYTIYQKYIFSKPYNLHCTHSKVYKTLNLSTNANSKTDTFFFGGGVFLPFLWGTFCKYWIRDMLNLSTNADSKNNVFLLYLCTTRTSLPLKYIKNSNLWKDYTESGKICLAATKSSKESHNYIKP